MSDHPAAAQAAADGPQYLQRLDVVLGRFFNLSHDLLCIAGFDGFFKQLNPSWTRTLGWSEAELLSRPFVEFVHPDDRDATSSESASLAEGDDVLHFENRYRCVDGSYRLLEWNAVPSTSEQLIYAAARDITLPRRQTELHSAKAAIARLTVDLSEPAEALPPILEAVCRAMGWPLGLAWLVDDETGTLNCSSWWTSDRDRLQGVIATSTQLQLAPGDGLPGLAWERGAAVTVADVASDERMVGRTIAAEHDLHGGVAFPVYTGGAVRAVLSFVSEQVNALDPELLSTVDEIGVLVGALLERLTVDEQMRAMAYHDPLTGLPNRTLFLDRAERALQRAKRSRQPAVLMMVDLDGFKQVNDSFGHLAGDTLLREIGRRMESVVRATDTIARLGGDEFGIILDAPMTAETADGVAAKLCEVIEHPVGGEGRDATCTASIGIAVSNPADISAKAVLDRADRAMYEAKRQSSGVRLATTEKGSSSRTPRHGGREP